MSHRIGSQYHLSQNNTPVVVTLLRPLHLSERRTYQGRYDCVIILNGVYTLANLSDLTPRTGQ